MLMEAISTEVAIESPFPVAVSAMASSVIDSLLVNLPEKNRLVRLDANNLTHAVNLEDYRKMVAAADGTLEHVHRGISVFSVALTVTILVHVFLLFSC
jgi:hypothetical protein